MEIDKTIFRRYDIRGKYPAELSEEAAYNVALSFANLFPEVKTVVLGGDARKTTPVLMEAVKKGLIDGGKDVVEIGIVITPVVFFGVCHNDYDAGIVITGSHLEGIYNGIKIVFKGAVPTTPEDYDNIMNHIIEDKMKKSEIIGTVKKIDIENEYEEYIKSKVGLKRPLKIVIDSGNGTARLLPEKIFKDLGCEVETIFAESDDTSPNHVPDPYRHENMQDLKKKVLEVRADLGIGFDGDGDRAGFVDSSGYILSGDDLLMIFAKNTLARKKGPIVADSRASMTLIEEVKKQGQEMFLTVGYHAAVAKKIIEEKAVFGGETTSHFYFPLDFYMTDDAVFSALKLAEIVSIQEDFVGFVKNLPRYATSKEIFIPFPDDKKYQVVDSLTEMVKQRGLDVNDVDGSRISFKNGWGIVRPSNTSPFIKVKFEGRTKKDLAEVTEKMLLLMREKGIELPEEE